MISVTVYGYGRNGKVVRQTVPKPDEVIEIIVREFLADPRVLTIIIKKADV